MIWKNRNNCVYNRTCKNPFTLKQVTEIMTRKSMASRNLSSGVEENTRVGWFLPQRDYLKINVDAAFSMSSGDTGLGVVARDKDAEACFLTVTKLQGFETPVQAEIKAIWFGLQVAKEMNCRKIQLESDCLVAMSEISKKEESFL